MELRAYAAVALATLGFLPAAGCRESGKARLDTEQAILERRRTGLQSLVARAEKGPLIPFDRVLAVVDESLIQQLLTSAIPFERVIKDEYRVTVDAAIVSFDDNFALVKLAGRVSVASRPDSTFADVAVYGALDIVELDPVSGILRGQVKVIGLDATKVSVMGVVTKTAEDLLEEFGGDRVEQLATLFSKIEIPVKLQREIVIPSFGADGPVSIAECHIPITGSVTDVTAFKSRLYVSIAAAIHPDGEPQEAAGAPSAAPSTGGKS